MLGVLVPIRDSLTSGEIQRRIGRFSLEGVRKCLVRMCDSGILERGRFGLTWAYAINPDHIAVDALRQVYEVRLVLVERLRGLVATWEQPPVFGAVGTAPGVEIVLGRVSEEDEDVWDDQVIGLERSVRRWTGSMPDVAEYFESEVRGDLVMDPVVVRLRRQCDVFAGTREWLSPGLMTARTSH